MPLWSQTVPSVLFFFPFVGAYNFLISEPSTCGLCPLLLRVLGGSWQVVTKDTLAKGGELVDSEQRPGAALGTGGTHPTPTLCLSRTQGRRE